MRTMNRNGSSLLVALSAHFVLVGCGGSTPPQQRVGDAAATGQHGSSADTPEKAVFRFLEAVRLGDDEAAGSMLTDLARQRTREVDMVVAPPGSDTATFRIGKIENGNDGVAQVSCNWTDLDHEGKPRTDHIVWSVRRRQGQWRIAGMSAQIFPNRPPLELDFENPEELLRQQQLAEQEALRQARQQQQQARKTDDPFIDGRK